MVPNHGQNPRDETMSDNPLEPRQPTLLERRREVPIPREKKRAALWWTIGLIRPHWRPMLLGIVLGFGVALTYATSLIGILPVVKVVVENADLHQYLLERGVAAAAKSPPSPWAGLYNWGAGFFPSYEGNASSSTAKMTTLLMLMTALLCVNILGNVFRVFSQYLVLYASHRTMMDLRRLMYRRALHLPMIAVSGDLSNTVNQFMSDTREVFLGITTLFGKVAREPLKAVCVLAVAIWVDPQLTLATIAIAPPAILLLWYFGRKVRKAAVALLAGYGKMLGALEETLQGIATVKGYAREEHERRRMWQLERGMLKQQLRLSWIEAVSSPLIEVVGILVAAAGIVWLAGRVFRGDIESGQFFTMVVLLAAMLDPVRKVANVYNMVQRSGGAAERIRRFLAQPEEDRGGPSLVASRIKEPTTAPVVRFSNITFRYQPDSPPVVVDVSLEVRAGECVAVVGPNGSGKSTLLRLLPRLLELQSGQITIGDREIRAHSLRGLRRRIAIVDQRPVIFARSVRDNIAYGNHEATLDEVRAAARIAYAAEFIESWPDQYDTIMGEFGANVSGGQRQRIAIARAFLKPATILIFDEATSEIDAESERKIHEALNELRRGKTTFLIAHRHTVMDMADRIIVMDAGRIIDFGTRDELLARCPLFVGLYRSPGA